MRNKYIENKIFVRRCKKCGDIYKTSAHCGKVCDNCKLLDKRVCVYCGKEYQPLQHGQKFCCFECRKQNLYKVQKERRKKNDKI